MFFSHLWLFMNAIAPPGSTFPFSLLLGDKSHLQGAPPHVLKLPVSMCITLWLKFLVWWSVFLFLYEFCENWDHYFLCSRLYTWSQCNLKEWINFIFTHSFIPNAYFIPKYVLIIGATTMERHCALPLRYLYSVEGSIQVDEAVQCGMRW